MQSYPSATISNVNDNMDFNSAGTNPESHVFPLGRMLLTKVLLE